MRVAGATGLEPATSGVTGRRSNHLNYAPAGQGLIGVAGPLELTIARPLDSTLVLQGFQTI